MRAGTHHRAPLPAAWALVAALATLFLATACNDKAITSAPPLDRYYFPTGLAVRHVPAGCLSGSAGCRTQLLTASSNYDIRYDPALGGTLIAIDVDQALAAAAVPGAPSPLPVQPVGAMAMGSFAGDVTILDAATCQGWTGPTQVLVPSRSIDTLYRFDIDAQGGLTCGPACAVPLLADLADPYGVTVACGRWPADQDSPLAPQAFAFVSYLRSPDNYGWLSRVDLAAIDPVSGLFASPLTRVPLQVAPTHESFLDPVTGRLYVTARFAGIGYNPLRWIELATPGEPPATANLENEVRAGETRSLALSSDRTRGYLTMRMYDQSIATYGARPIGDVAGVLLVLDMTETPAAGPAVKTLRVVPLDRGAIQVRAIPRPGQRDLVVTVSSDDSSLTLYDDELGAVVATLGVCGDQVGTSDLAIPAPCSPGRPLTGAQPYGLVVDPLPGGLTRLYVGSFDRSWVNVIDIDPVHPTAGPSRWVRLGTERP